MNILYILSDPYQYRYSKETIMLLIRREHFRRSKNKDSRYPPVRYTNNLFFLRRNDDQQAIQDN